MSILEGILLHLAYDLRIYFIIYNSMRITPPLPSTGDLLCSIVDEIIVKMFNVSQSCDGVKSLIK